MGKIIGIILMQDIGMNTESDTKKNLNGLHIKETAHKDLESLQSRLPKHNNIQQS